MEYIRIYHRRSKCIWQCKDQMVYLRQSWRITKNGPSQGILTKCKVIISDPSNFALSHIRLKDESAKVRGATTEHHKLIKVYEEKIVSCKQWILYSRPLLTSLRFAMLHKLWQISSNRWELAIERKNEERSKQKHKYNTVRWTWLGKG